MLNLLMYFVKIIHGCVIIIIYPMLRCGNNVNNSAVKAIVVTNEELTIM